jgi:hypothetical protein
LYLLCLKIMGFPLLEMLNGRIISTIPNYWNPPKSGLLLTVYFVLTI